jgi:hypothetical protein
MTRWVAKMINYKVVQTAYCIELSIDEFQKIMDYDGDSFHYDSDTLHDMLAEIGGISEIDYDAHFGANVYVIIDKEHDNGKTWNQIDEIITKIIS